MIESLRLSAVLSLCAVSLWTAPLLAGGLIPDRYNQVLIEGKFQDAAPAFLLIFSAEPLKDDRGRPLSSLTLDEIRSFENRPDCVAIKVYGKPQSKPGRMDVFFGTAADADRPWNDGRDFDWHDWEKYSADVWDHVYVVPSPTSAASAASRRPFTIINNVTIRRGGKLLYDSRARESYPNKRPINVGIQPFTAVGRDDKFPVLNLSDEMARFRRTYYEIGDNPILSLAYSDVAQTDKRKYANRGTNWCSEFATSCYRQAGYKTPDPNAGDVHWKNMREFFEKNGHVYSAREVAAWTDREKLERITPGSFVSILIGEATHSLIFTTWVSERGQPITRYTALSGNNKGMVWPHDPLQLPTADDWKGKSSAELEKYDAMVYFAVPAAVK